MAGILAPRAVFGVKGNVRNNIAYVEDAVVVYISGSHIVKAYTHSGSGIGGSGASHEYLPCSHAFDRPSHSAASPSQPPVSCGVTCMALSSSRRYIAVGEKVDGGDTGAIVAVYNVRTLTRRRVMYANVHYPTPDASIGVETGVVAGEVLCLSFSVDDTLLVALAAPPTSTIIVFAIDRARPVAHVALSGVMAVPVGVVPLPVALSFSPVSIGKIALWGRNALLFLSVDEVQFKSNASSASSAAGVGGDSDGVPGEALHMTHAITALPHNAAFTARGLKLHGRSGSDYTAQCWLPDDSSVVATAGGEILLFKRDQFVKVLECSPNDARVVDVIVAFSRGFMCAGEGGLLRLYEYADTDDTSRFALTKTFKTSAAGIDCEDRIRSMCVSPTEDTCALAVSGNQLQLFDLAHANVKDETGAFSQLGAPAHGPAVGTGYGPGHRSESCAILGMDVCVRKPLLATVGVDNTVRVWNYVERTCEVCKLYPEGPTSVAFHPSGMMLCVGFNDKLRLLNILMDDIRDVKEFPIKSCPEVRFSHGGHMFAAAYGNVIQVFLTYTAAYLLTLRGHNGKVTCLNWSYNDATILSCAADGTVYEWDLLDGKRARDFTLKGVKWSSAVSTKDGAIVYAVGDGAGSDGSAFAIREIDMNMGTVLREFITPLPQGALAYTMANPKMLFTVTSAEGRLGTVRSYNLPLTSPATGVDYCAVAAAGVRMCTSHDDSHLFVAGADGCICVYEVRDRDGRLPTSEFGVKVAWSDEIMVTVSDLDDKKNAVRELREAVAELQSNNDYAMRMKDIAFQEQLKKITERYTTELEQERQQFDLLREEKLDMEREYTERLNAMEIAHRAEMQKRESLYQGKIMEEVERYQGLQSDVESQRSMWTNKRSAMMTAHNAYMGQLTADYERKLEAARERRSEAEDELAGVKRDWEEMHTQMDDDLDTEIESMKRAFQEKLDAERDATLKFKGENGIMRKKFAALTKEIDENKEEIKRMLEKQKGLRAQIESLEKEITVLRTMIHEKDVAIAEKEKRIYELKKKNQELEKFKFVLDYKIKELKQQIEPRENEIAAMKKQIKEVDGELEAYHKSNAELDELIGKLRAQLDALQTRAVSLRGVLIKKESDVKDFSATLHDVVHAATTPEALMKGMEGMASAHAPDALTTSPADASVISESERQREHLAALVDDLKRRADGASVAHKHASARLVEENMGLIEQIKSLREHVARLRLAQKSFLPAPHRATLPAAAPGAATAEGAPATSHASVATPALMASSRPVSKHLRGGVASRGAGTASGALIAGGNSVLAVEPSIMSDGDAAPDIVAWGSSAAPRPRPATGGSLMSSARAMLSARPPGAVM